MAALTPKQVLGDPGLLLVDIRPLKERYGSVGFVPGSISVPMGPDPWSHRHAMERAAGGRMPVLVCLSGRRALHCAEPPGAEPLPYLEGGVLEWTAAGLPVSGQDLGPSSKALHLEEFPRHMAACFVGELAEVLLDRSESADPLAMLERCFSLAGVRFDDPSPEGLLRVLDVAALLSLQIGTPIERVARNLDHMLVRLPASTWELVA